MTIPWRSRRTAWILMLVAGALAVHFHGRARRIERELTGRTRVLEADLNAALARAEAMAAAVAETSEKLELERRERADRRRAALAPMPEGVRLALVALRDCLREDGHDGLRVLRARSLLDRQLLDVELWDYDPAQLISTLYVAGRMQVELDRAAGVVALRLFDGHLSRHGERREFPEGGYELRLPGVSGSLWEARLPYLVVAEGEYPEVEAAVRPQLDPLSRREWKRRLDRLLDEAGTTDQMRIGSLSDLDDGSFREIMLLAYDDNSLLVMAAHAEEMVVRVDEPAGLVQLELRNGVLRRQAGETPISDEGFRILLPDVSPSRARDLMLGMVVER